VTSEVLPGIERHFESFSAAEREASQSRIFAGVHFSTDEQAGQILGRRIARGNGGWPSLRASRRSNPSPPERPWGEPGYSAS
jgi:hypothetical protein